MSRLIVGSDHLLQREYLREPLARRDRTLLMDP